MILKLSLSSEKKKQLRRMTMTYHSEASTVTAICFI